MIEAKALSFSYSNNESQVLRQVDFQINAGEFILLTGPTGSGKSTLLRALIGLSPHFTGGQFSGEIAIDGLVTSGLYPHDLAHLVGYVNQQPEGAFATDTVGEELAFGMEQLGIDPLEMRSRVQSTASLVGLSDLLDRPLDQLSGGQQQRVAIGSAIAAGQMILLLDEPTSSLDDRGANEVLELLRRLSLDERVTVVVSEHRVERLASYVDRVFELRGDGSLCEISFGGLRNAGVNQVASKGINTQAQSGITFEPPPLSLSYGKQQVLHPIALKIRGGNILTISGHNGSGKSSLLWCLLRECWRQDVDVAMVPQNAADLLILNTVSAELSATTGRESANQLSTASIFERLVGRTDPKGHPRDLSVGQQLALALAIQVSKNSDILLLDEPTRGLDAKAKSKLVELLMELRHHGRAIVLATHDDQFAQQVSDETIRLDDGRWTNAN